MEKLARTASGRPARVWTARSESSGSIGPAGPVTSGLSYPGCMFARTETSPKGSVSMRSGRRIQRRQWVSSQASTEPQPRRAGSSLRAAAAIAAAMRPGRKAAYASSRRAPRHPMAAGALCECVADTSICCTGMPLSRLASALAASSSSRGIMQESTTHSAIRVDPLSSTMARAWSRSWTCDTTFSRNPPFTRTGNWGGVTSTAAAPARNGPEYGSAAGSRPPIRSRQTANGQERVMANGRREEVRKPARRNVEAWEFFTSNALVSSPAPGHIGDPA